MEDDRGRVNEEPEPAWKLLATEGRDGGGFLINWTGFAIFMKNVICVQDAYEMLGLTRVSTMRFASFKRVRGST